MCEHALTVIAPFPVNFYFEGCSPVNVFQDYYLCSRNCPHFVCCLLFVILLSSVYHQEHCFVIIKLPQVNCRDKLKLLSKTKKKRNTRKCFCSQAIHNINLQTNRVMPII